MVARYFGDPAGMQASGQTALGDVEIFKQHGICVESVRDRISRNIIQGVNHVRGFIENANGQRFLHLDNKCKGLAEDLENYRYPEHREGKDLKPEPIKDGYHDHGCDMVRYFFTNHFPIVNRELKARKRWTS